MAAAAPRQPDAVSAAASNPEAPLHIRSVMAARRHRRAERRHHAATIRRPCGGALAQAVVPRFCRFSPLSPLSPALRYRAQVRIEARGVRQRVGGARQAQAQPRRPFPADDPHDVGVVPVPGDPPLRHGYESRGRACRTARLAVDSLTPASAAMAPNGNVHVPRRPTSAAITASAATSPEVKQPRSPVAGSRPRPSGGGGPGSRPSVAASRPGSAPVPPR